MEVIGKRNNTAIKTLTLMAVGLFFFFVSCNTNTYFGRWMTWRASDIKDFEKFPSMAFEPSSSPFTFIPAPDNSLNLLPVSLDENVKEPLHDILNDSETTAFIVIKNDSLIYERYFNGYNQSMILLLAIFQN